MHTGHLPVPLRLPVPLTVTLHDLRNAELAGRALARRLFGRRMLALALRAAAGVITVSEAVGRRLEELFDYPPTHWTAVPNAADHFEPLPRAAGPGAPLLHVGHLEPRKNLELLLEALALDPGLPPLELAGAAKGGEDARLRRRAAELGVADRVRFPGPFDDAELPALYARAGCVVMPSRLEGFGIPVLEAQRARAPLAISSAGALVEVAGPGVPRFDPGDAAGCAAALRSALAQPAEALEEAARRAGRFSWDGSARLWVAAWGALQPRGTGGGR